MREAVRMVAMKRDNAFFVLYFGEERLGEVRDVEGDQPWMGGTFLPDERASQYRSFFQWMVDEDQTEDPPFAPDLLDEENWFVCDASGKRRGISIPAVHDDGAIAWRWR
jgi:hypothetical protein